MPAREILTVAEMSAADRAADAAGASGVELMERAGAAVAEAIAARFHPGETVVLAGPGNNGGDGYVVARLLKARGWPVRVAALAPPKTQEAIVVARRWEGGVDPLPDKALNGALVVDALFGAGLDRPLKGEPARLARTLEGAADRVVAVLAGTRERSRGQGAVPMPAGAEGDPP